MTAAACTAGRAGRAWLAARYRWLRDAPDRARHRARHRKALEQVAHAPLPRAILVVCYGNVCRSPYLEAALRRDLPPSLQERTMVHSAGFVGPHRGVPAESHAACTTRGLALGAHRSRLLTRDMVRDAGLVLVMSAAQATRLAREFGVAAGPVLVVGDLDPSAIVTRTIRDPWGRDVPVFAETFDRLDRCAAVLARALRSRG